MSRLGITVVPGSAPATSELVEVIVREHDAAEAAAVEAIRHAAACGRALIRLKEELPHGGYIPFVEENLPFTRQTAAGYKRIAEAICDGRLQMESASSVRGALKQLAAPKAEKVAQVDRPGAVSPRPYVVDSDRQRQLAEKAAERFWAASNQITSLDGFCEGQRKTAGEALHLDRVLAVVDHDQLREHQRELGRGIRRARELYEELGEALGEAR